MYIKQIKTQFTYIIFIIIIIIVKIKSQTKRERDLEKGEKEKWIFAFIREDNYKKKNKPNHRKIINLHKNQRETFLCFLLLSIIFYTLDQLIHHKNRTIKEKENIVEMLISQ